MLTQIITALLLVIEGPLLGMFICSSMVEHSARTLAAPQWIAYKQAKELVFGPVMPVVFNAALVVAIIAAFVLPEHLPLGIATALLVAALAITVKVHLPLNKLFQGWAPADHPVTWDAGRRRWRDWNLARTAMVATAFGFIVASL